MSFFSRSIKLEVPRPTSVRLPESREVLRDPAKIRRMIHQVRESSPDAEAPAEADRVVQALVEFVATAEKETARVSRTTDEQGLRSTFDRCVRLGVATAEVEERWLSPRRNRIDGLGVTVLTFVAMRETQDVPEQYRVIGHYLVHLGHYWRRVRPASWDAIMDALGSLGVALDYNARYLVMAEASDAVWMQHVES